MSRQQSRIMASSPMVRLEMGWEASNVTAGTVAGGGMVMAMALSMGSGTRVVMCSEEMNRRPGWGATQKGIKDDDDVSV